MVRRKCKGNAYRDRCFAVQDYSAAIQNMLLAIVELGYQSCWYEGHITDEDRINEKMAAILNVPGDYELVCFLPVGIAENTPMPPKKKDFTDRAWFNSFPASKVYDSQESEKMIDCNHAVKCLHTAGIMTME
ncbi:MAG: nitroreductase family protein [Lachnospiraceae bacterium]|nr:nitroreductase family protein [Lachnospiraceae bacterium]